MLEFMKEGGYASWLVLLLGGLCLGLAISFAIRPGERKLAMLRPLSLATVFAILGGVCAGLAATMKHVANQPEWSKEPVLYTMIGIGESMASAILGFTLLMLAWLVATAGMRRQV